MRYGRLVAIGLATLVSGALIAPSASAGATSASTPAASSDGVLYDDLDEGAFVAFTTGNKWTTTDLTYSFDNGTGDMAGTTEQDAIRQAFDLWSAVTPLRFTQVASNGDIHILFASGNHGGPPDGAFDGPLGVLAHAFYPGSGFGGDAHFDDAETWSMTPPYPNGTFDLVSVAAHEFGHSLGLGHSSVTGALMYKYYAVHRFLHDDDIAGIQSLYGSGGTPPPPPRTFSVNDVTVAEPESGVLRAEFTVSLSAASASATSVVLETFDGTALRSLDYRRVKRTIRIPAGQTSKVVTIPVKSDKLTEPTETFAVTLTAPKNAVIGDGAAVGTILDID